MPWRGGVEGGWKPAEGARMEPRPVAAESGFYYGLIRHESPVAPPNERSRGRGRPQSNDGGHEVA
jgi:hypothetical protein